MSTNYIFSPAKTKNQVLKAMKKHNITVAKKDKKSFCITNGECYVWCYEYGKKRKYIDFVRYGGNYDAEQDILEVLADELDVSLYSEYTDEYAELMGMNDDIEEDEDEA